MKRPILIHLATGFEEIEAVTIIDVLRRADLLAVTVSVTGDLEVTGAHGITLKADQLYDEADYTLATMIILPGGMPGTSNLLNHKGLCGQLEFFSRENKWIGAICAAPMVLGTLGILHGKKAVCYPGFESKLEGAILEHSPFVTSGNLVTGKGVGAALDFSLEIVRLLKGEHTSKELRTALVIQ
jgi:4-methyl-5(b-hydroxyethyl)-thiazole monophosphate biosynthesis